MASAVRQMLLAILRRSVPPCLLLTRSAEARSSVYLTFDDGPDPVNTPRILDCLRRHDVRATFFVVGHKARRHPDLIRRIRAEGHRIGSHSYYHHHPDRIGSRRLKQEMDRTDELLTNLTGERPALFRPPHGKLTIGKMARILLARQTIVLWNRDPKDFAISAGDELGEHQLSTWFQSHPCQAGDIVLLHDTSPITAAALDNIVTACQALGLSCDALPSRSQAR